MIKRLPPGILGEDYVSVTEARMTALETATQRSLDQMQSCMHDLIENSTSNRDRITRMEGSVEAVQKTDMRIEKEVASMARSLSSALEKFDTKLSALSALRDKGEGAYWAVVKIAASAVATTGMVYTAFQILRPLH